MTGKAMLTVRSDKPFLNPTGLARLGRTIFEDDFSNDMRGWTQLFTPDSDQATAPDNGNRIVSPLCRIARSGTYRLALLSPGISDLTSAPIQSMGIKRSANFYGQGRYLLEMVVSLEAKVSQPDRPLDFGWGLDTANDAGLRRFFKVRFWNYSETSSAVQSKFQVKTGTGSTDANYTDITGGGINVFNYTNENKALPFYIALDVDTATGKYKGFRFGNLLRVGSLAETPDTSLEDLGAIASESLTTFLGGVNPCFDITNRTNAARTQAQSNLHWSRLSFLG